MTMRLLDRARRLFHRPDDVSALAASLRPGDMPILFHPHDGHIIALACPACGEWRRDPTAHCGRCGL